MGRHHSTPSATTLYVGMEYTLGDFTFYCAEKLSDKIYAMQMSGVADGKTVKSYGPWPLYQKNNACVEDDYCYQNILAEGYYDPAKAADLKSFWDNWSKVEAMGGRAINTGVYAENNTKNGMYLVPYDMVSSESNKKNNSENYYYRGLYRTANNRSSFGAAYSDTWLGSHKTAYAAYRIYYMGDVGAGGQNGDFVLAPAFNLDASKIRLDDTTIYIN